MTQSKNYKKLYIIGASGFGRELADTVRAINVRAIAGERDEGAGAHVVYGIAGYIDDDEALWGKSVNEVDVLGGVNTLLSIGEKALSAQEQNLPLAVIAIADPGIKKRIAERLDGYVAWENIIHPSAIISASAVMGRGNIIQPFCVLSANAKMGDHCCLNVATCIGHDSILHDYVSVMPRCDITGCCDIGEGVYIATGVCVVPGTSIGESAIIGAGSVVVKDVEAGVKAFGHPAKRIG